MMPFYRARVRRRFQDRCRALRASEKSFLDVWQFLFREDLTFARIVSTDKVRTIGFHKAREIISSLADAIRSEVKKNDCCIALDGDNCVEWVYLFWAILKSGNKPFLINPSHPVSVSLNACRTLGVAWQISLRETPSLPLPTLRWEEIKEKAKTAPCSDEAPPFGNEIVFASSGTEDLPKLCVFTGREICEQILIGEELTKRNPSFLCNDKGRQRILALLPFYHIFGLISSHLWFSFFGAEMIFSEKRDPASLLQAARTCKATHIFAVPAFWKRIARSIDSAAKDDEKKRCRFEKIKKITLFLFSHHSPTARLAAKVFFFSVRRALFGDRVGFCITGGSDIENNTMITLAAIGYPLYNGYGMTEIGIVSVDFSPSWKDRIPASIGTPFSGVTFTLSDTGTLQVASPTACRTIYIDGKAILSPSPYDTGDLAEKNADGRWTLCGRAGDLVLNDNAENINPLFAERLLHFSFPLEYCVFGNETKRALVLLVSTASLSVEREVLEKEVWDALSRLPIGYPIQTVFVTTEPLASGLKLGREALRKRMMNGEFSVLLQKETSADEESETHRIVRNILGEVLGIEPDKIPANARLMNELGGTSLDYMAVICEIEAHFGIRLPIDGTEFGDSLNDFVRKIEEMKLP